MPVDHVDVRGTHARLRQRQIDCSLEPASVGFARGRRRLGRQSAAVDVRVDASAARTRASERFQHEGDRALSQYGAVGTRVVQPGTVLSTVGQHAALVLEAEGHRPDLVGRNDHHRILSVSAPQHFDAVRERVQAGFRAVHERGVQTPEPQHA